ncbi:MAG TPA: hypothetical protein VIS99_11555 [Terrimicrobiaceae bacterium]
MSRTEWWRVMPKLAFDTRRVSIAPNTIGAATVVNGRMFVPAMEEQYAARKPSYAALNPTLAGAPNFPRRWSPDVRIRANVSKAITYDRIAKTWGGDSVGLPLTKERK